MSAAIDELKHWLGYVSDQNISGNAPTARSIAAARPAASGPYRKLLWLVPAVVVFLLIGTVGIYAVVNWLIDRTPEGPMPPAANNVLPTPEPTAEAPVIAVPTPTATPAVVYVDPTPEEQPVAEPIPEKVRQSGPRPKPQPQNTRRVPEPRKTPAKKPKPTQDPNCVFTNSCK